MSYTVLETRIPNLTTGRQDASDPVCTVEVIFWPENYTVRYEVITRVKEFGEWVVWDRITVNNLIEAGQNLERFVEMANNSKELAATTFEVTPVDQVRITKIERPQGSQMQVWNVDYKDRPFGQIWTTVAPGIKDTYHAHILNGGNGNFDTYEQAEEFLRECMA